MILSWNLIWYVYISVRQLQWLLIDFKIKTNIYDAIETCCLLSLWLSLVFSYCLLNQADSFRNISLHGIYTAKANVMLMDDIFKDIVVQNALQT